MSKYSIEYCQKLAGTKGGKCLSYQVNSVLDRLKWECSEGHIWVQRLHNVNRGTWCPKCACIKNGINKRRQIEQLKKIAEAQGGSCLSEHYDSGKLLWKCKKGHEWKATASSIIGSKNRKGTWCPVCRGQPRVTMNDLIKVAAKHNGTVISDTYRNAVTKYIWQCEQNHQFQATWDSVRSGTWCPSCAGRSRTIEDVRKIANERGGTCLSDKFHRTVDKLWWRCASGHKWKASLASILRGSWCPCCQNYFTEERCRFIVESMTGLSFPKTRIRVHNESLFVRYMELDGYNKYHAVAFEHHGIQHYRRVRRFHKNPKDYELQIAKDKRKIEICKELGIELIVIPYQVSCMGDDVLIDCFKSRLKTLVQVSRPVDFSSFKMRSPLEKLQSIAKERNGKCLSVYYSGPHRKMHWECGVCGCQWKASAASVKNNGSWCPDCARRKAGKSRRKYTLKDLQNIAKSKGGRCLSSSFSVTAQRVKWECNKGHQWESIAMSVIRGSWCKRCAHQRCQLRTKRAALSGHSAAQ